MQEVALLPVRRARGMQKELVGLGMLGVVCRLWVAAAAGGYRVHVPGQQVES